MLSGMPPARHASLTAAALACGLSSSTSLTNWLFPWARVAAAGIENPPGGQSGQNARLTTETAEFEPSGGSIESMDPGIIDSDPRGLHLNLPPWAVSPPTRLDWEQRRVFVEPAEDEGRSRRRGQGQHLSHELCDAIRRLLAVEAISPSWSRRAVAQVEAIRSDFACAAGDEANVLATAGGRSPRGRSPTAGPTPRRPTNRAGGWKRGSHPTAS
jgi:hypothetical protein